MSGKCGLVQVSVLFVFATLAACGSGGGSDGGGVPAPTISPVIAPQTALPRTGQTACYDPFGSDSVVDCAGTGQDGELQTGVAEPSPRLAIDSTSNCISDNLTGLMWARNANLPAGADAPDTGTRTWQAALDFANNLDLCGFGDWRLPNRNELRSLVNHQQELNNSALTASGFSNVMSGSYWSSTSYSHAGNAALAWSVVLSDGRVTMGDKGGSGYVWPVRSGQ